MAPSSRSTNGFFAKSEKSSIGWWQKYELSPMKREVLTASLTVTVTKSKLRVSARNHVCLLPPPRNNRLPACVVTTVARQTPPLSQTALDFSNWRRTSVTYMSANPMLETLKTQTLPWTHRVYRLPTVMAGLSPSLTNHERRGQTTNLAVKKARPILAPVHVMKKLMIY